MNITLILVFLVIQFIVQLVLYHPLKKFFRWVLYRPLALYKWLYLLGIEFDFAEFIEKAKPALKTQIWTYIFAGGLFGLNLFISLLVKAFTSAGAMTGMTNLLASVFIGCLSAYDIYKFKKAWNTEYNNL